jgi:predicted ArsR family transcriptional regulator
MSTPTETSDAQLLALLNERGAMSVSEVAQASEVTATAVRQRLTRLMGQGLVARDLARASRGRPSHRYSLTEKARRQAGSNFADLAIVLWEEMRGIKDPDVRRGLLERLATTMARMYADKISGATPTARMNSLKELFAERRVPLEIVPPAESAPTGSGPVLTVVDCPYPELAEKDRGVCAMERMLFSQLLETPMRLSQCRLDGHACCQFETN